jgi:hypothetical protein
MQACRSTTSNTGAIRNCCTIDGSYHCTDNACADPVSNAHTHTSNPITNEDVGTNAGTIICADTCADTGADTRADTCADTRADAHAHSAQTKSNPITNASANTGTIIRAGTCTDASANIFSIAITNDCHTSIITNVSTYCGIFAKSNIEIDANSSSADIMCESLGEMWRERLEGTHLLPRW